MHKFLAPRQNSEKFNDPISGKHPDRCQEAKMDRPLIEDPSSYRQWFNK